MRFYKHTAVLILALLLIGFFQSLAQYATSKGVAVIYPSFKGNLITLSPKDSNISGEFLAATAYFKISRAELQLNNKWTSFKKIGQTKRCKTLSELRAVVSQDDIEILQNIRQLDTEQKLQAYLDKEYHFDSLKVLGVFSYKFLEAFGISYDDKLAESGVVYTYKITRVDKSGKEEPWAEAKIVSKIPNPLLGLVKIKQDSITSNDSLILFNFHAEFPKTYPTKPDSFPQYSPINTKLSATEQQKQIKAQNLAFINHLNAAPIDPDWIKYNIYYQENRKGWKFFSRYQVMPDSAGVYRLGAFITTTPESLIEIRVIPETFGEVLSSPDSSEIFGAYAISQSSAQLVYSVKAKDSTDCIIVNWQLSAKPYHDGVLIERREADKDIETLVMLSSEATSYTDPYVKPGVNYTYFVKALFNPLQKVVQKAASTASMSCTKFTAPMPPYNLRVDSSSKEIPILKWDAVESKSRFGFIVYRGTDPKNLSHLGNIVKGNTFSDSTGVFSPRARYYYAVIEQNFSQDTSGLSNIVDFTPKMALEMDAPKLINFKLINGSLFLDWPEMRIKDSFVAGYHLERRNELDTIFRPIGPKIINNNFFIDTTYNRTYYHEYRLAAVADNGQMGPFSVTFEVDFPLPTQSGVSTFSLRNTTRGIMVRWPSVSVPTTKEYIIYRNDPPKAQLRKLATVPAGSFEYVDTAVSDTDSYLYAMSIVAKDGVESQRSPRKSLKRAKPNKLPTTPNAK